MIIPWEKLSKEALENLIREFVLREGTDYGTIEQSLETKEKQIRKQLESGAVFVVFDPKEETASILNKDQLQKLQEKSFQPKKKEK